MTLNFSLPNAYLSMVKRCFEIRYISKLKRGATNFARARWDYNNLMVIAVCHAMVCLILIWIYYSLSITRHKQSKELATLLTIVS